MENIQITIASIPRPFRGEFERIQMNSIKSWKKIAERIILFEEPGNGKEIEGVSWKKIQCKNNIPLFSDALMQLREVETDFSLYSNSDIILLPDIAVFFEILLWAKSEFKDFLAIGKRIEVDFREDFTDCDYLKNLAIEKGVDGGIYAIDYFLFPSSLKFALPDLYVGRPGMDTYVIQYCKERKIPILDLSVCLLAIHQNHSYFQEGGIKKKWTSKETDTNMKKLTKVWSLEDVDYVIESPNTVNFKKNKFITGRLETMKKLMDEGKYEEAIEQWEICEVKASAELIELKDFSLIRECYKKLGRKIPGKYYEIIPIILAGKVAGAFHINDEKLCFTGNLDASAKILFEKICQIWDRDKEGGNTCLNNVGGA